MDDVLLNIQYKLENFNAVKKVVLDALLDDKIISKDIYEEYSNNRVIILYKVGWFKKWCTKLKDQDEKEYKIKLMTLD